MPRVLYLVSEDWYFVSHRLPMARAARDAGYEVHVATTVANCADEIQKEGFVLHSIPWHRGSINPMQMLSTLIAIRRLYQELGPDLVHHVAFVPSIVGSIAGLGMSMAKLNAITGLGYMFTSNSFKARLLRPIAGLLLKHLLRRPRTWVLVQNPDDETMIMGWGVSRHRIARISGSGVDVEHLAPMPEPGDPFTIGFIGRLLYDKGVETLVRAQQILTKRGLPIRVLLAGTADPSNPSSIPEEMMTAWRGQDGLALLGHVNEVATVWAQAHVAVLPSRREGLPKTLLEAAACGRPLIATDVPGCREIVRRNVNGLLVPPDDAEALAGAIERLKHDRELRIRLGRAARDIVVNEFSAARVGQEIVMLYARLLARPLTSANSSTVTSYHR